MPYIMERAEYVVDHMRWARKFDPFDYGLTEHDDLGPALSPSELFRRHIYGCFIDDRFGVDNLDAIGIDHVMMEADYPHGDGTFPHTPGQRRAAAGRPRRRVAVQDHAGQRPSGVRPARVGGLSMGVVEDFVTAYNTRDWAGLAACFSADDFERIGPYVDVIDEQRRVRLVPRAGRADDG